MRQSGAGHAEHAEAVEVASAHGLDADLLDGQAHLLEALEKGRRWVAGLLRQLDGVLQLARQLLGRRP